jgi:guanylate kinase
VTTRPPRPDELDGSDYRFVSPDTFRRLVEEGAFLEHAEVFGHRYGTLAGPIWEDLSQGTDVVLEIDVQGAAQIRERFPDAVLVFLAPPSEAELERRLRSRATEDDASISRRLEEARRELEQTGWFDHVVINDRVDRAAEEVAAIIAATGHATPGGSGVRDERRGAGEGDNAST